ncbi:MAG TPA: hypothetical protein VF021_05135 [Longimicrobiales bacterium]
MDELIVVTHPEPVRLEARPLEAETPPEGNVALAYYCDGKLLARGYVAQEAVRAIRGILSKPVSVALAATEDQSGNIEARFCLVLPVDPDKFPLNDEDGDEGDEPWRASVPDVPSFESDFDEDEAEADEEDDDGRPRVALLPIGNVVRNAHERHHPDDMARDLRDMLVNLIEGRSRDAVAKAIDDLLNSL